MRITIKSTPTLTELNGACVRVWTGVTERGVPCKVFVATIAVGDEPENQEEFARELEETTEPRELVHPRVIPLRLLL